MILCCAEIRNGNICNVFPHKKKSSDVPQCDVTPSCSGSNPDYPNTTDSVSCANEGGPAVNLVPVTEATGAQALGAKDQP